MLENGHPKHGHDPRPAAATGNAKFKLRLGSERELSRLPGGACRRHWLVWRQIRGTVNVMTAAHMSSAAIRSGLHNFLLFCHLYESKILFRQEVRRRESGKSQVIVGGRPARLKTRSKDPRLVADPSVAAATLQEAKVQPAATDSVLAGISFHWPCDGLQHK